MKKIDKRYIYWGTTAFIVICLSICFYFLLVNGEKFDDFKKNFFKVLSPLIDGMILAYLLNPILNFIERKCVIKLLKKINLKIAFSKKKAARSISLIITMLIFFLLVAGLILLIVPQLLKSIQSIIIRFPSYLNSLKLWTNQKLINNPDFKQLYNLYWGTISDYAITEVLPSLNSLMQQLSGKIVGSVIGTISFAFNFIVGIILSIYLLYSKETYCAQIKKIIYSLLREERANTLINNLRYANNTFGGFISGKIIDSIIIGLLCFIVTTIMQTPYALLVSVTVGVTNIIPFFGPFIGGIASSLLVLMINPSKALWLIIFVVILQQFDGNILGPKILGDSTGLSSFWIIFAITVSSGFFGFIGMFIGVPVFAVIYAAIRTFVNTRLDKKQLPVETSYYLTSDYHSINNTDEQNENKGVEIRFVKKTFENIVVEGNKKNCEKK